MRITVDDVRAVHCVHGIRAWFRAHDLDFRAFVRHGIDADVLVATGDQLALDIVERKRRAQREEGS
ncbi:hypothetical protein [uncultured Halomonas sp.]|uniref:hypothetical protein n=1 Tax=uncultured Halomonas sp. TaxID=173971 RepID=UPI00262FF243|nr:hypothetical protein [uncultured Halomonas sp.]